MKKHVISGLVTAAVLSGAMSTQAVAHQAGDIIVRAGVAVVAPNESSEQVATFGEFLIDDNTQLGLNFGYMLTDNIGVELLAASPFTHDVSLKDVGKIAETKHLPPTLMAQYYFGDAQSKLRPYLGLGVNFTVFFDNEFTNDLDGALSNLSLSNSWGLAAQAGMDYQLNKDWLINGAVWYTKINTDVSFNLGADAVSIETDIDPWVYMLSVGYRF
ncbi:outer membrane protein OmpW [Shewanella gelidii]|uniref:Outer membrane protein W n=1 Tax=Shewanella gelidii TaxID=1642821 RepID=A0A917JKJ8_9GAMM|nr:outer membrane protein OmpW [Shewanella gelidii]MCL1097360.1 outer membrane protein OmpW [Shewanella gelidii]GGI74562.1 outer membrane protein OmpW [Shewanella gelidii]